MVRAQLHSGRCFGVASLREEPFELGGRESWERHPKEVNGQGLSTLGSIGRKPGPEMGAVPMSGEAGRLDHKELANQAGYTALSVPPQALELKREEGPGARWDVGGESLASIAEVCWGLGLQWRATEARTYV